MKANNLLNDLLMLGTAIALLLPATSSAQRRPIAPPGTRPASQASAPKAEPQDEAKKDEAQPPPTPPTPSAQPSASPAASQPAVSPGPTPDARDEAAAEEGAASVPAAPKEPELLLPKDELGAALPAPQPQAAAASAPAREVLYRKKLDRHSVTLRVRPARPQPARSTALVFEVVRLLETPDPAFGSRKPVENGAFVVTFSLGGQVKGSRRLHALENAGTYGLHFTAPEPGVYRVALNQELEKPEIGEVPLTAEFLLGFGKETPMEEASGEEEDDGVQVRRSRRTLRVVSAKDKDAPADLMVELGEHWMALRTALSGAQADPAELAAHAEAIKQLAAKIPGRAPAEAALEFEQLAARLEPLSGISEGLAKPASALELMDRVESDACNRCHARFRFRVTDDVGKWPQFTPKTGD